MGWVIREVLTNYGFHILQYDSWTENFLSCAWDVSSFYLANTRAHFAHTIRKGIQDTLVIIISGTNMSIWRSNVHFLIQGLVIYWTQKQKWGGEAHRWAVATGKNGWQWRLDWAVHKCNLFSIVNIGNVHTEVKEDVLNINKGYGHKKWETETVK